MSFRSRCLMMLASLIAFGLLACQTLVSPKPPACPAYTPEAYHALLKAMEMPELRPLIEHLKAQQRQCAAIDKMR